MSAKPKPTTRAPERTLLYQKRLRYFTNLYSLMHAGVLF